VLSIGVDVGGTFTDVVAVDEHGSAFTLKVPTTPHAPQLAVLDAVRSATSKGAGADWIGHSTTIATNALLGQIGLELPRVALITTHGFCDVIEIGRQNRSRVYDLFVDRPKPLVAQGDRLTVRERIDACGAVLEPIDEADVRAAIDHIRSRSIRSVAVCLLNSYANPEHERRAAAMLRSALPSCFISCSCDVNPEYREYERFSTTVVSAALAPIVSSYLDSLAEGLRQREVTAPLFVMRSDGGMSEASIAAFRPASLIESGPASGAIAAADIGRRLRMSRVLSFDMGGTTAKAGSIIDGAPEVVTEYEAAGATHSGRSIKGSGYPVRYPFVDLSEVSAGGGTIAWVDGADSLRVGPISAGADPGPACYGKSDRATVTDANVLLGRLHQTHLLGGTFPIDAQRSRNAIASLAERLGLGIEETAEGIVTLVNTQMAKALRIVSVERGEDPRDFALVAFGGGGPLHGCALAQELGIERIVVPQTPGLLSAQGLLVAELSAIHAMPLMRETRAISSELLEAVFAELEVRARDELRAQGAGDATVTFRRSYDARYRGQSFELRVEHAPTLEAIEQRFHQMHRSRYGYAVEDEMVELVNARLTAVAKRNARVIPSSSTAAEGALRTGCDVEGSASSHVRSLWLDGSYVDAPVFQRDNLLVDEEISGPAIIEQYDCTTYVAPGWNARVLEAGVLDIARADMRFPRPREVHSTSLARDDKDGSGPRPELDPVTSEVIRNALFYASEEMGIAVRNSAYSPNIKERLDHSCALFDRDGRLIAQAEHIPVHLGSLPWGLRQMLAWIAQHAESMSAGEMWIANDPYITGTHLNDITVVRPIFFENRLVGYAASKAHHADIGGASPGSMSPTAADLFAEGLVIPPMRLVAHDEPATSTIEAICANSRTPQARAGDLRAQIAGNYTGERRLLELFERYGSAMMEAAFTRAFDDSERRLRAALRTFGDGVFEAEDFLEKPELSGARCDLLRIRVRMELRDGGAYFDYTGTDGQVDFPLNAVFGVTLSGVHYAVRAVSDPTIPMNEGCFRPVRVQVPEGALLNPRRPAPVSGGNVETSTRNADVVLQAFSKAAPNRIPAASGGTMSNVLLGGIRPDGTAWAFYETNGCGMGARPTKDGLSGIQCHMTNTMNTPIEAIEREFPLRVTRYEFAHGTGGNGEYRGGDGLIRELQLVEGTARASLIADRHVRKPPGASGGDPGACGRHSLRRDGRETLQGSKVEIDLETHDIVVIQTPGGGGYGAAR
jgi:5-oxoprolinase (ATP-hydrolysing)